MSLVRTIATWDGRKLVTWDGREIVTWPITWGHLVRWAEPSRSTWTEPARVAWREAPTLTYTPAPDPIAALIERAQKATTVSALRSVLLDTLARLGR